MVLLCVLAALVGVIGGVGAWVFRLLIGFFHNLLFLGAFSHHFDATVHTVTPVWGIWIIGVPVIGAVGVAWLVKTFAPEAKGHGVPEVMDATYYNDARIRPIVVVIKSLASALSIGSGGSIGREGPIIQIGATFGSVLGGWISMPVRQRVVLMAAGAGAGIAATFNYYTHHMLGMAIVGLMMYLLQRYAGHFYVEGVGYATIMDVLVGALSDPGFLVRLFALKLIATCLTLGSGGNGLCGPPPSLSLEHLYPEAQPPGPYRT